MIFSPKLESKYFPRFNKLYDDGTQNENELTNIDKKNNIENDIKLL